MRTSVRHYTSSPLWYALLTAGVIVGIVAVVVLALC